MTTGTDDRLAAASIDAALSLADRELALPPRLGYVALLLGATTMTSIVTALWLTEPVLPIRAQAAFGVMIGIGLSWASFAVWVLRRRRVLLGQQSIVAGRMAVAFTTIFILGALLVGYTSGTTAGYAAAALGLLMLGAAAGLLLRAHRTVARLGARRRTLELERARSRS